MKTRYDVIIVGSGAGGGTMAHALRDCGKNVLLIERGDFLPREQENWDAAEIWMKGRYRGEEWLDARGKTFEPESYYCVGGNTKVYGSVLCRFRERDFEEVQHHDGVSPRWPLQYSDYEPYYGEAEKLYQVHGNRHEDPTEPHASTSMPFPSISHEPRIEQLSEALTRQGLRPSHLPLGIMLDERNMLESRCIRCNSCGGFPCMVDAKSDADVCAVRPAIKSSNITLMTNTMVRRVLTNPSGNEATGVEIEKDDQVHEIHADVIVLAAGTSNTAKLLLASCSDQHPRGLGNRSDQVGRNFVMHHRTFLLTYFRQPNPTKFQGTLGLSDFYFGDNDYEFPLGRMQMMQKLRAEMLKGKGSKFLPDKPLKWLTDHTIEFLLTGEDLPDPKNRITLTKDQQIRLSYKPNNLHGMRRFEKKMKSILSNLGEHFRFPMTIQHRAGIMGLGHQGGTCRMGADPESSVVGTDCQFHDIKNLYVSDGSFFPSIGACNPTLTIIANSIRVSEFIRERIGAHPKVADCTCNLPIARNH